MKAKFQKHMFLPVSSSGGLFLFLDVKLKSKASIWQRLTSVSSNRKTTMVRSDVNHLMLEWRWSLNIFFLKHLFLSDHEKNAYYIL